MVNISLNNTSIKIISKKAEETLKISIIFATYLWEKYFLYIYRKYLLTIE